TSQPSSASSAGTPHSSSASTTAAILAAEYTLSPNPALSISTSSLWTRTVSQMSLSESISSEPGQTPALVLPVGTTQMPKALFAILCYPFVGPRHSHSIVPGGFDVTS